MLGGRAMQEHEKDYKGRTADGGEHETHARLRTNLPGRFLIHSPTSVAIIRRGEPSVRYVLLPV
jgi:hypothetical protein